jgi:mannosyltransferase OCH1-like enzyme
MKLVHQVWIGSRDISPRLLGYCENIRNSFPDWKYKLWTESDMEDLSKNAFFPKVVRGEFDNMNIGTRSDIVRLEILRQHGGVYFDADIDSLRSDLRPLFVNTGFTYADYFSGGPGNQVMAADEPENSFIELFLIRIRAVANLFATTQKEVLAACGPVRLKEVLNFYVGKWNKSSQFRINGQWVGNKYVDSVTSIFPPIFFPYWFTQGSWKTFKPEKYSDAWGVHHWQADWHPGKYK